MWDPRTYRDEDFGLDNDAPFEPEEEGNILPFDLTQPHIMTVLGPIEPDELGICAPMTHLLATASDSPDSLTNLAVASQELESWILTGGRSVVEITTRREGRDLEGLRSLAQRNPAHVIASTGPGASRPTHPNLREEIIQDITVGVGPKAIRSGLIHYTIRGDRIYPDDAGLMGKIAEASNITGAPVIIDLQNLMTGYSHQDYLLKTNPNPKQLILANPVQESSLDAVLHVLRRGSWLLFANLSVIDDGQDAEIAKTILELADAGFADQLLVSTNLTNGTQFVANTGPGLVGLLERFPLTLMELGAPVDLVRQLLIENPARALTIHRPDSVSQS